MTRSEEQIVLPARIREVAADRRYSDEFLGNVLRAALSKNTGGLRGAEPKELDVVELHGTILEWLGDGAAALVEVNFSDGTGELITVQREELHVTWRAPVHDPVSVSRKEIGNG